MNINKKLLLVTAIVLINSVVCYSQDIVSDFDQALAMVPEYPLWPSGIMYYDMQDAANSFISKHNDISTVEFLKAKIEDPNSRKLALLSLAKLAASEPVAERTLQEIIHGQPRFRREALTAIAYLQPADGRRIAAGLLARTDSWRLRIAIIEAMVGLGDQHTLEVLKQMRGTEHQGLVKRALESAIDQIGHRLTQVPHDRQVKWAEQEVLCWRTVRESPRSRAPHTEQLLAAETLYLQGRRLPRDFLECKLNAGNILGILIIGNQREAWAIESLKRYAALSDFLGSFARNSLGQIGTSEALRALEALVVPGMYHTTNTHVFRLLGSYGDRRAAEYLRTLSEDERFTEREHILINRAYEVIERRLSGNATPRTHIR